jgi:hypothetical protein
MPLKNTEEKLRRRQKEMSSFTLIMMGKAKESLAVLSG